MNNKIYESPQLIAVEIEPEGVLCSSTETTVTNPFGSLTEEEW